MPEKAGKHSQANGCGIGLDARGIKFLVPFDGQHNDCSWFEDENEPSLYFFACCLLSYTVQGGAMSAERMSYAELVAYAAGETDEPKSSEIAEYLQRHPADAGLVARFRVLSNVMIYIALWQPSEFLTARAKSLYRVSAYPA